jgi:hypothetical protein
MEENILIGYKGRPLKDVIGAKRSNSNAFTLEAPKVPYTPTVTRPPYSRYRYNQRYSVPL